VLIERSAKHIRRERNAPVRVFNDDDPDGVCELVRPWYGVLESRSYVQAGSWPQLFTASLTREEFFPHGKLEFAEPITHQDEKSANRSIGGT
jgi:hypothetical protein